MALEGAGGAPDASASLTTLRVPVVFRPVYTPFARKPVAVLDPCSTLCAIIVINSIIPQFRICKIEFSVMFSRHVAHYPMLKCTISCHDQTMMHFCIDQALVAL